MLQMYRNEPLTTNIIDVIYIVSKNEIIETS